MTTYFVSKPCAATLNGEPVARGRLMNIEWSADAAGNVLFAKYGPAFVPAFMRSAHRWCLREEDVEWIVAEADRAVRLGRPYRLEHLAVNVWGGPEVARFTSVGVPVERNGRVVGVAGAACLGKGAPWSLQAFAWRKTRRFSPEKFVAVLTQTGSLEATAALLGVPAWYAEQRLYEYLASGVNLRAPWSVVS